MANQVRTIIKKKRLTAEKLDKIKKGEERQNKNDDTGTALEGAGQ